MLVIDAGGGGGSLPTDPVVTSNSNEGSTTSTGAISGNYSGSSARVIETHAAAVEKVGALFVPYDPQLASILAMNF